MSQRSRSREKTKRLFQRVAKKTLQKPEILKVSQWAEKYRILDGASNLSGHWSNDITPYLVEIMDTYNDPDVREVYLCKASQVGGTSALINILCYIITQSPAPTMIVYPNDDLAKDVSNDKLKPAFRLIPKVQNIFMENASKELRLKFKTMVLYLRGAGSASKLASKEIKYLFFDEIDKMGGATKKEASPYNLALERTKTYRPQEKIFACSTPTLRTNYIWQLHENADEVKHYFVPCPHCGTFIELKVSQIMIDEDKDKTMSIYERAKTAKYICQECGCEIEDSDKPQMLREGRWQVVKKRGIGKAKSVGYWINSIYSIFLKWSDIMEEFLKTKDDPDELQNYVNSWLAEPWEDVRQRTNEDLIMEHQTELEEFTVPEWAKLITGGMDVQQDCVYYTLRAWGDYTTSQNITHGKAPTLEDAERLMNMDYKTEDGRIMVVKLVLVDSGYRADDTYDFCVGRSDWMIPVKGSSVPMYDRYKISHVDKKGSRANGMPLVIVDGDQFKDSIAARLEKENGTGSWMVYRGCDEEYAKQVTAEQKITEKVSGGRVKTKWVPKKTHIDNHYLDCEVYAMAAAEMMGVRTLHLESEQKSTKPEKKKEAYTPEETWLEENENWI